MGDVSCFNAFLVTIFGIAIVVAIMNSGGHDSTLIRADTYSRASERCGFPKDPANFPKGVESHRDCVKRGGTPGIEMPQPLSVGASRLEREKHRSGQAYYDTMKYSLGETDGFTRPPKGDYGPWKWVKQESGATAAQCKYALDGKGE